jgi:hypothetical protein
VALVDIVNQVNTTLTFWYANQAPAQTLYTSLGRTGLIAQDKYPPAVIWVPTGDSYEGTQVYTGGNKAAARVLRSRILGVDAWLWAAIAPGQTEDFAALDVLINATIGAVHQNLRAAYRVISGTYQGMDDSEPAAFGRCYVLRFSFIVPVTELALAGGSTVVTAMPQTNTMAFPDGSTATNP